MLGAAVGDSGVCLRHLAHGNLFRTQSDGRVCIQIGFDTALLRHVHHLVGADFRAQLGEAGVGGNREGALDGTRAVVGAAVVLHFPTVDVHVTRTVEVGIGRNTFVQRSQQSERLEGRTRLTLCLRCQVELVGIVAAAADERLDEACVRVDRHHGKLQVAGKRFQLRLGSRLSRILNLRVERSDNRQTALEHFVGGIILQQGFTHVAGEVLVLVHAIARAYRRGVQVQLFRLGGIMLSLGDNAVGKHAVEHQVAALLAVLGVVDGVVVRGRLGNADKRGRLGKGKVLCIL